MKETLSREDALDLILFGNHGIARLEGSECFEAADIPSAAQACHALLTAIQASIADGGAVELADATR